MDYSQPNIPNPRTASGWRTALVRRAVFSIFGTGARALREFTNPQEETTQQGLLLSARIRVRYIVILLPLASDHRTISGWNRTNSSAAGVRSGFWAAPPRNGLTAAGRDGSAWLCISSSFKGNTRGKRSPSQARCSRSVGARRATWWPNSERVSREHAEFQFLVGDRVTSATPAAGTGRFRQRQGDAPMAKKNHDVVQGLTADVRRHDR